MELIKNKSFGASALFRCSRCAFRRYYDYRWRVGHQVLPKHRMPPFQVLWQIPLVACGRFPLSQTATAPESRSAIWYSDNMVMKDSTIDGPKFFREMKNLYLENVNITDADETFWKVDGLKLKNVKLHDGTYPFMFSKNIYVDGLESDSKYVFQYCRNVEIHNAKITTKDSFWECENVTVYDSELNGEYLAWHSKNIKFVRCHISGEQPLCYMDHVTLEDCTFDKECDRAFEDCTNIDAQIKGSITNIKNPISGRIEADEVGSVTYTEFAKAPKGACKITDKSK